MSTPVSAVAANEDILSQQSRCSAALRLLQEALQFLDESEAPTELGGQLDLVINRLERAIHASVQRR